MRPSFFYNADHELRDGYQSFGHIFPAKSCFDYKQLNNFLSQLKVERIKGILKTNKVWFIINGIDGNIKYVPTSPSANNRIEIIASQNCNGQQKPDTFLRRFPIKFSLKL